MTPTQEEPDPYRVGYVHIDIRFDVDGKPRHTYKWEGDSYVLLGTLRVAEQQILYNDFKGDFGHHD